MLTRKAAPNEVRPALELSERVLIACELSECAEGALDTFKSAVTENRELIAKWESGEISLYVAADGENIVGMIAESGEGHITALYVDPEHHRKGIATALMEAMVVDLKSRGFDKISLNASDAGIPFYKKFGFKTTGERWNNGGILATPMTYEPKELWDVYDICRRKTGRLVERNRTMSRDEYHIVIHAWLRNSEGKWLVSKRSENKAWPLMWECTGGSALAGETAAEAAIREVQEELGVELSPSDGDSVMSYTRNDEKCPSLVYVFLFKKDVALSDVKLQPGETCDARFMTTEEITRRMEEGTFIGDECYPYIESFFLTEG